MTGLQQTEIKELRKLLNDYRKGDVDEEHVYTEIAIYSQINKRSNLLLQGIAIAAKYNADAARRIMSSNLIGNDEAIDIGTGYAGNEKVVCDIKGKVITRDECLDISGSPPEGIDCSRCEHFATTRQMLVDGNE